MKIDETELEGVRVITPDAFEDERGWFYSFRAAAECQLPRVGGEPV